MSNWPNPILFGAAYYFEYQPDAAEGFDTEAARTRLKTDLDLMVEAGFSVIRVGESVWSTWEPENGRFDLDWLQPVLDGAHERGIAVILGTPTYAVPPWLVRLYPGDTVRRCPRISTTGALRASCRPRGATGAGGDRRRAGRRIRS